MMNYVRSKLIDAQGEYLRGNAPTHIICAIRKPDGTKEVIVNTEGIANKISYLLDAYDDEMCLKNNSEICIVDIMVLYRG
jgi:hypothetical protein